MHNASFVCWSAPDGSEEEAQPAWKRAYDWQTAPYLSNRDFERAAELFAGRVHSDWDYPDEMELFVKNESTGETRFVTVTAQPGGPEFSAECDEETSAARLLIYGLTALARAALAHRPRPWNWKQLRWEREHPEEAAAKKAEQARTRWLSIDGKCPWPTGEAPASWADVIWPEWIPEKVRTDITRWDRSPAAWEQIFDWCGVRMPKLGERLTLESWDRTFVTGRFVPMPNEQGAIVDDEGVVHRVHSRSTSVTAQEIAAKQLAWRTELLRKAAEKAVKEADANTLERMLAVLPVGKPADAEVTHG